MVPLDRHVPGSGMNRPTKGLNRSGGPEPKYRLSAVLPLRPQSLAEMGVSTPERSEQSQNQSGTSSGSCTVQQPPGKLQCVSNVVRKIEKRMAAPSVTKVAEAPLERGPPTAVSVKSSEMEMGSETLEVKMGVETPGMEMGSETLEVKIGVETPGTKMGVGTPTLPKAERTKEADAESGSFAVAGPGENWVQSAAAEGRKKSRRRSPLSAMQMAAQETFETEQQQLHAQQQLQKELRWLQQQQRLQKELCQRFQQQEQLQVSQLQLQEQQDLQKELQQQPQQVQEQQQQQRLTLLMEQQWLQDEQHQQQVWEQQVLLVQRRLQEQEEQQRRKLLLEQQQRDADAAAAEAGCAPKACRGLMSHDTAAEQIAKGVAKVIGAGGNSAGGFVEKAAAATGNAARTAAGSATTGAPCERRGAHPRRRLLRRPPRPHVA
jgi:hypothetical protein